MDGVSGVVAIVSFSIQLIESIQKAKRFLNEVRNAPEEVIKLVDSLDEFEYLLIAVDGLIKRQNTTGGLPSSIEIIERALRRCRSTITTLETCVHTLKASFDRRGRLHKTWASIQATGKKDVVDHLREQVEGDMNKLRTALNINMSHLQLHQIELVTTRPSQVTSTERTKSTSCTSVSRLANAGDVFASHKDSVLKTKETNIWRYQTPIGEFRLRKKSRFLRSSDDGRENALSEESCLSFIPYQLRTAFEIRSSEGLFQLPRSLSIFPVIQDDWTFYEWCFPKNLEAFKQALTRRELSPYTRDSVGRTFLQESIRADNPELCSLLVHLGVDVNHRDDYGEKPVTMIGIGGDCKANALRTLLKANCDIDLEDLEQIFELQYWGSIEAAELLLSAYGISSGTDLGSDWDFPFLMVPLREFGVGENQWKSWIQRLLRCKADVHISRSGIQDNNVIGTSYRTRTALDDLFQNTRCPFKAEGVAREWLQMLAEAGFDVNEYLEQEKNLHSEQNSLIDPYVPGAERQLIFQMDGIQSVSWEWWFDPLSPGSLVCHEFRAMSHSHGRFSGGYHRHTWEGSWPYCYPKWSEYHCPGKIIYPLDVKAQEQQKWQESVLDPWQKLSYNAHRRHECKYQKKYPQSFREQHQQPLVPGAWVDD